jgi:hypothetical protein
MRLEEEGGWPIGFVYVDSRWVLDDGQEVDNVDYIFRADGTKVCDGVCTGVCSSGACDGGIDNIDLSLIWTEQLLLTGRAPCGTLGYDSKDVFIAALRANAGRSIEHVLDTAWAYKDKVGFDVEEACYLIHCYLSLGCDVNALIPSRPGLDSMTPLQSADYLDLPVVCEYLRGCGAVLWEGKIL